MYVNLNLLWIDKIENSLEVKLVKILLGNLISIVDIYLEEMLNKVFFFKCY